MIVNERTGIVVGGHQRLKVLKDLGYTEIEVSVVDLTDEQEKALNVALNKISGEWDFPLLKDLLEELDTGDFDVELTGFDLNEIEDLMTQFHVEEEVEVQEDDFDSSEMENEDYIPFTKRGDIWQLGKHRLMCGDSTSIEDVEKLMNGKKAVLCHTDPPYNVDYSNADRPKASKTDLGKIKNDKMGDNEFLNFLQNVGISIESAIEENAAIYVWYASKESINFFSMFDKTNIEVTQQIIWKKPMLLGRSRYQWAHEPCLFAVKGSPHHTDDRTKTTVWDFGGYDKSKNIHPTQKPLFLPSEAINNSSKKNDIVLDLFGGSGSTLIACEQLGRQARLMELDEKFCDAIIKRWEEFTGEKAVKI